MQEKLERKPASFFRGLWAHSLVVVAVLVLFGRVMFSSSEFLEAPDCPPHGMPARMIDGKPAIAKPLSFTSIFVGKWRHSNMLGEPEGALNPLPGNVILFPLLDRRACQVWSYVVDLFLLYLATLYLLGGKGVSRFAALAGALAMALSTHTFTLVSAGHLSKTGMMPFAVFTLAFLDRAIERRSLFHFAMAGLCAGIGLSEHQDVMAMFCLLAAAYGIVKWTCCMPGTGRDVYAGKVAMGLLIGAIFFVGMVGLMFRGSIQAAVAGRQTVTGDTPERKWDFATSWSMPREEMLEFFAPCVYGTETGDPAAPYWGRLGRSTDWESTRQGLMNLRQHTVYLGVLQLIMAVFAVVWAIRVKGKHRCEVFFWLGAWIVCVLLALGRYGPGNGLVYRLFYSLPYASGIRCPVKFMHLIEVATVILFAFGLDWFIGSIKAEIGRRKESRADKKAGQTKPAADGGTNATMRVFAVSCGALAVVCFIAAIWASGKPAALANQWEFLGFGQYAAVLAGCMAGSLGHAGLLFCVLAGLFFVGRKSRGARTVAAISAAMVLLLAVDLVSVDRRYVRTQTVADTYGPDPIVDALRDIPRPFRVACPSMDGISQHWMKYKFPWYRIDALNVTDVSGIAPDYKEYFQALGNDFFRLWQLASVRFVVGPQKELLPLTKHPAFRTVMSVAFARLPDGRVEARPEPVERATHILLENLSALPRAVLFYAWESVDDQSEISRLTDRSWNPWKTVLVSSQIGSGEADLQPEPVAIQPDDYVEAGYVRLKLDAKAAGILLLNEKYDPSWDITIDGQKAELLRCNFIMRGVKVPMGPHEIVFRYRVPHMPWVRARYGVLLVSLAWLAWVGIRRIVRRPGPFPSNPAGG